MPVLVWTERFFPEVGGLEKSTYRFCNALVERGISVCVITKRSDLKSSPLFEVISCGDANFLRTSREVVREYEAKSLALFLPRLAQGQEREHFDALSSIGRGPRVFLRIPTTSNVKTIRKADQFNQLQQRVDVLIAQNSRSAMQCEKHFPSVPVVLSRNKAQIPGSFTKNYRSHFVFASRIAPSKNLLTLLHGYELYQNELGRMAIPLRVFGPAYSPKYFESCVKWMHKLAGVRYFGTFSPYSTTELDAASFTVIPSFREGHSNLMLESIATGTPVIASSIPGLIDDAIPWGIGIAKPSSKEAIAETLLAAHSLTEEQYIHMCASARSQAIAFDCGEDVQSSLVANAVVSAISSLDISVIVIKPEALSKRMSIIDSLHRRGFEIMAERHYRQWTDFVCEFYADLSSEERNGYLAAGKRRGWTEELVALVVSHESGSSLQRATAEKGGYDDYQKNPDGSLRAEFGFGMDYNCRVGDRTLVFNGIHATRTIQELVRTVFVLRLEDVIVRATRRAPVSRSEFNLCGD